MPPCHDADDMSRHRVDKRTAAVPLACILAIVASAYYVFNRAQFEFL